MIDTRFFVKKFDSVPFSVIEERLDCVPVNREVAPAIIEGVNNLLQASEREVSFLTNVKYLNQLKITKSKTCLIEESLLDRAKSIRKDIAYLVSKTAYFELSKLLNFFYSQESYSSNISDKATISPSARLGKDCFVAAGVVIGDNVTIGDNAVILPNSYIASGVMIGNDCFVGANVTISYALIGDRVEIFHSVSIGQDGFGFAFAAGKFHKLPQFGKVVIGSDVSIGANSCIDRGSMEDTIIEDGTKIDNLVQIGHNVKIGKHCLVAGQSGFAGSSQVRDFVAFGGQAGIAGHIIIGFGNRFAAQSGITKNIPDKSGDFYGYPAKPKKIWQREQIALKNLAKEYFSRDETNDQTD